MWTLGKRDKIHNSLLDGGKNQRSMEFGETRHRSGPEGPVGCLYGASGSPAESTKPSQCSPNRGASGPSQGRTQRQNNCRLSIVLLLPVAITLKVGRVDYQAACPLILFPQGLLAEGDWGGLPGRVAKVL